MQFFEELGRTCEARWRERECRYDAFPSVAEEVLRGLPPSENVQLDELTEWLFRTDRIPEQADPAGDFGDPPVVVYSCEEFRVEVLFWLRGDTAIHEHSFSGAFHLWEGASLHSEWRFEEEREIEDGIRIGELRPVGAEGLARGDTRGITAGSAFVHATFHLARPTISVVVRTHSEEDHLPQYSYLYPSLAYPNEEPTPELTRKLQLLRTLGVCGHHDLLRRAIADVLRTGDPTTVLHVVTGSGFSPALGDEAYWNELLTTELTRFPELSRALSAMVPWVRRQGRYPLGALWRYGEETRLLLAALSTIPDRRILMTLVRDELEGGVAEALQRFVRSVSGPGGLMPDEPAGLDEIDGLIESVFGADGARCDDARGGPELARRLWPLAPLCQGP